MNIGFTSRGSFVPGTTRGGSRCEWRDGSAGGCRGSCHARKHGFADPNRYSKGLHGKLTDRHAMTTANLRYNARNKYFWDERADGLEKQVLMPIQSKLELGQDLKRLNRILARDDDRERLILYDGRVSNSCTI